ncbi:GIY-YIG nuclease family protein [Candidatus Microgenomates bacterium]|nr:GIY-YIG nuclease family protein [Candidatus Microgenomates bacterium]
MHLVYILKSKKNGRYYIGSTNNLQRRLKEHKLGKSLYTKNLRPWELVFSQKYAKSKEAKKIEYKLKRLKRKDIIEQIIKDQKIKMAA